MISHSPSYKAPIITWVLVSGPGLLSAGQALPNPRISAYGTHRPSCIRELVIRVVDKGRRPDVRDIVGGAWIYEVGKLTSSLLKPQGRGPTWAGVCLVIEHPC